MWIACLAWIALFAAAGDAFTGQCTRFPALCCRGVDSSCRRDDCYCDSYCTTNHDCCSDYIASCNGVTQAPPAPPIAADQPVQAQPDTTLAATSPQSTATTATTTMTTPTIGVATVITNVTLPLNTSQTTTTAIQTSSMGPAVVTNKSGNTSTALSTSVSQPLGGNTTSSAVSQGQQATTGSNAVLQTSLVNATTVTTGQMTTTLFLGTPSNNTSNASQSTPTVGPGTFPPTGPGSVTVSATGANQTNTTSTVVTTFKTLNTTQVPIQGITSTVIPALSMLISAAATTAQLNNTNGTGVTGKDPATGSPISAPFVTLNQSTASGPTVSQTSLVNATSVTTGQMATTTFFGTSPNMTSNASQSTPTAGPGAFPPTGLGNVSVSVTATGPNQTNTTSTLVTTFKTPNTTQATIQGSTSTVTPPLSMLISAAATTAQFNNTNGTGVTGKDLATGSPISAPLVTSNQSTASGPTGSQSLGINSTTVTSVQMMATTLPVAPPNKTSTASPLDPSVGPGTFSTSGPGQVSAAATSTGANQTNTASPVVTTFKNPNITQGSILGNASAALTASFASTSATSTTANLNNTNGTGVTWKDPATMSLISGSVTPSNQSATSGPTVSQVAFANSSTLATVQMVASTMTTTSPNRTANASQPTPTTSLGAFSTFGSGNMSVAAISTASNQTNTTSQAVTMMKNPNITQGAIQTNTSAVPPTSSMLAYAAATTVQLSNTSGTGVTGKDPSTADLISAQVVLSNQSTSSGPTGPQVSFTNVTTVAATQIVATTLPTTSLNKPASTSQSIPPAVPGTSTTAGLGMSKTVASSGTNQTNTSTVNMTEFKSSNTVQANASATPSIWSMLISGATTTQLNNSNETGATGTDAATGPIISAPVAPSNQNTTSAPTGPQSTGINATTVTIVQMAATTSLGTPPNNSSNVSQPIPTTGPGTFSTANAASPVATAFKSPNATIQTNTSAMPPALSMLTSSAATTAQLNNTKGTGVTGNEPGTGPLISAPGVSSNQSTTPRATGPQDLFVDSTTVTTAQVAATTVTEKASQSVPTVVPGTFPTSGAGQESRGANQSKSTSSPVTAFNNTSITQANTSAVPAASSALNPSATISAQLNNTIETMTTMKYSATASTAGGSNQSITTGLTGLSMPAVNLTTQATSSLNVSKTTAVIPDNSSSYTISVNSPTGGTPNVEQRTSSAPLYTGLLMTKSSNANQTTGFDSKPAVPTASLNPTTPKQRVKKSQVITLQLKLLRTLPIMSILEIENQLLEMVRTFIKEKFPNVTISASMRIKEKRILRFTAS